MMTNRLKNKLQSLIDYRIEHNIMDCLLFNLIGKSIIYLIMMSNQL